MNFGLCSFFVCVFEYVDDWYFPVHSSAFWKGLHYSLGWMILSRCTLSRVMTGHITCLVSVSAVTTLIFRNRGRLMASLFINVLYSSILAGASHSWVFFESVTVFDIVIHRQIYWFIYRFLFLNQLTLGFSAMVVSHVDISAHLHLSNISDLVFFPSNIVRIFFFLRTSKCPLFQNAVNAITQDILHFALIFWMFWMLLGVKTVHLLQKCWFETN